MINNLAEKIKKLDFIDDDMRFKYFELESCKSSKNWFIKFHQT